MQYECLKTELKEEYDKRVNFLHKRIEMRQAQQGPYQDAHLILMQNSLNDISSNEQTRKKAQSRREKSTVETSGKDSFFLPGMKNNAARRAPQSTSNDPRGFRRGQEAKDEFQPSERDQYYKFYLDSAQKAIEMMRK